MAASDLMRELRSFKLNPHPSLRQARCRRDAAPTAAKSPHHAFPTGVVQPLQNRVLRIESEHLENLPQQSAVDFVAVPPDADGELRHVGEREDFVAQIEAARDDRGAASRQTDQIDKPGRARMAAGRMSPPPLAVGPRRFRSPALAPSPCRRLGLCRSGEFCADRRVRLSVPFPGDPTLQ